MLLMTKVKNAVKRELPDAIFNIHNISINGVKKGCSGFVENDGVIVYFDSEHAIAWAGLLYRYARSMKDYTGMRNMFTPFTDSESQRDKDLIVAIVAALKNKTGYQSELSRRQ